jgi:hypothetical protein
MHSLTIPRGVGLLAGGTSKKTDNGVVLEVSASEDDEDWQIVQSPFMLQNARTVEFRQSINVTDDRLSYKETTILEIYGKHFEHTDENEMVRQ